MEWTTGELVLAKERDAEEQARRSIASFDPSPRMYVRVRGRRRSEHRQVHLSM
jgi:hypothetical protein